MAFRALLIFSAAGVRLAAVTCDDSPASCARGEEETTLLQVGVSWPHGDEEYEGGPRSRGAEVDGHGRSTAAEGGDGSLCGIKGFRPYAGYTGELHVSGKMWVRMFSGATPATAGQAFTFRLHGVDARCSSGPGPSPDSCGVQIHQATSCASAGGGHHWNKKALRRSGCASYDGPRWPRHRGPHGGGARLRREAHRLRATRGFHMGHPAARRDAFGPYVTKFASPTGRRSRVDGSVTFHDKPGLSKAATGVYMSYELTGVDARCSQGPGVAQDSCGVRLHKGTSCRDARGHRFNGEALRASPWPQVSYVSSKGKKKTTIAVADHVGVNMGLAAKDISGHVLIVYDFLGKALACGIVA
eukprot:CAMPEP_0176163386 /NCGR_PEP_ID=MMETSP0120_2-20121206/83590_1 /TAXON_ID=160619 /ORGANISM="Kryptoperidinium foliaceum, Strain CCMP 1326" /LENGTH=356 /DNA_ID=CAMNT_0017500913 /DNA_START=59 /DNA_END=1130 /DNA_ORIENTATION=-